MPPHKHANIDSKILGTALVRDPAYIVGRITLVMLGLVKYCLGCVSSDAVGLYFYPKISSPNLTKPDLCDPQFQRDHVRGVYQ